MARLTATLEEQFAESARLEEEIRQNLKRVERGQETRICEAGRQRTVK